MATVADILSGSGTFTAKIDLGGGYSVKLTGPVGLEAEATDLAALAVDGRQATDKAGLLKVGCPDGTVTVNGVATERTYKRSATRPPLIVWRAILASVGLDDYAVEQLKAAEEARARAEAEAAQLRAEKAAREAAEAKAAVDTRGAADKSRERGRQPAANGSK
jgi:hypothetical protein